MFGRAEGFKTMWPTLGHVCDTDVCMALDSEVFRV